MLARPNLDLDALRSFALGLELGSFAKAADRVGRSASAVSEQLARLETQFGRPLLRKQGRGLVPTDAGETALAYARRLLELNDEAVAAVRGLELEGWVRLGVPQDFAELLLSDVLGRFARQHPKVRMEARAERNAELLPLVESGRLDLALVWGEPDAAHRERLAELPMRWIGSARAQPNWNTQEPLPLVMFEAPCYFRSAGLAALDKADLSWRVAFSSPSLSALWAASAAGLGISVRTGIGLPASVRPLGPGELDLPDLPSTALSLLSAEAAPAPAVAALGAIVRETILGAVG